MNTLCVIVPVYNNEETLPDLLDQIESVDLGGDVQRRAVFVVDGSPDNSESVLRSLLPTWNVPSTLVVLSRNFGSFLAIRAGLEYAEGDIFAVLAADLQEPPELLEEFTTELAKGEVDVVLGERAGRADPFATRTSSATFWWIYRRFVQPEMPRGGVDVFACNDVARSALLELRESNTSLIGLLLWLGLPTTTVTYERRARPSGKSGWTLGKRVRYMSDSIFSFTDLPVRLLLAAGVLGCVTAVVVSVIVLVARLAGWVTVPGYAPIMLSVLFVGGILTFGLGIVGSYAWRTYDNTKRRPLTVERSIQRFDWQNR